VRYFREKDLYRNSKRDKCVKFLEQYLTSTPADTWSTFLNKVKMKAMKCTPYKRLQTMHTEDEEAEVTGK